MKFSRIDGIEKDWSRITLGCWQIAPSDGWGDICSPKEAEKVVHTALDHEITAFDTAEGYGNETGVGHALKNAQKTQNLHAYVCRSAKPTLLRV